MRVFRKVAMVNALTLVSSFGYPLTAHSDQAPEQVVVTGSYASSIYDNKTSNVTVIDREQIMQSGKGTVLELLRSVVGLSVRQSGGSAGVSEVNIRGGESNFNLVLIDGVKVNDSSNSRGGGFNFNSIDLEQVEKIEILRGVQTAIYGGEALSGVINIVTRPRLQDGLVQHIAAELGEQGHGVANYHLQYGRDSLQGDISLSRMDSGSDIPFNDYENIQAMGGFFWSPGTRHRLQWRFRVLDDSSEYLPEQSGGDKLARSFALESMEGREYSQHLGWRFEVNDVWQSSLELSYFTRHFEQDSPGIFPFDFDTVPPNSSETDYEQSELVWVNSLTLLPLLTANVGISGSIEEGDSGGSLAGFLDTSFELERNNEAAFMELRYERPDLLQVQFSVRHEDPEDLATETSYSASLALALGKQLSLQGSWGKGFKLPSFFALGHALVGNPDLKPERAETADLRLVFSPDADFFVSIAYFDSHFEDLIDFDPDLFINVNRDEVNIDGVELVLSWYPLESLALSLFASGIDIDTGDKDVKLSGRPEQQYGAELDWQLLPRHALHLSGRRIGERYDTSLYSGSLLREELDAYNIADLNYRWSVNDDLELALAVDNLTDEDYVDAIGFSSYGRNVRIKARYELQ